MGLDSIELVMEIEKYFAIQIPDAEAEKIFTIQLMVESVSNHLGISNSSTELQKNIFNRILSSLPASKTSFENIDLNSLASKYLSPHDKEAWNYFKVNLGLEVPAPDFPNHNSSKFIDKLKRWVNWVPNYDWYSLTMEQFTNSICAANYLSLIDKNNIRSIFEVYVAVVGITVDKIGVDYYEVLPEKSFTTDLGVD